MTQEPQVLKEASCPSLSNQSTITYEIGITPDGTVHIRLTGNSGTGKRVLGDNAIDPTTAG